MDRIGAYFQTPKWSEMKLILKDSLPYFLYAVFAVLYFRINAVMLSLMVPENTVGWFAVAYRFFDMLMFLPSIYTIAVFPVLSKLWNKNNSALAETTQKSLRFIILAGIPISIGVFVFSDPIIELFFGIAEFGPSSLLLKIFSAGLLLVYIDFILGTAMFASDRHRQWTIIALCAMILNPLLNYFLIPLTQANEGNGGIGAAIATLITEFFVMAMALVSLPHAMFQNVKSAFLWKGIGAGICMAVVLAVLNTGSTPWVVSALVGFTVYLFCLLLMKVIEPEEKYFIWTFFSYKNLKTIFEPSK
jgi:O-antigen/teichoic acid export membrane protein